MPSQVTWGPAVIATETYWPGWTPVVRLPTPKPPRRRPGRRPRSSAGYLASPDIGEAFEPARVGAFRGAPPHRPAPARATPATVTPMVELHPLAVGAAGGGDERPRPASPRRVAIRSPLRSHARTAASSAGSALRAPAAGSRAARGRGTGHAVGRRQAIREGGAVPRRNRNALRLRRPRKPRKHRGRKPPAPLANWSVHSAPRGLGR